MLYLSCENVMTLKPLIDLQTLNKSIWNLKTCKDNFSRTQKTVSASTHNFKRDFQQLSVIQSENGFLHFWIQWNYLSFCFCSHMYIFIKNKHCCYMNMRKCQTMLIARMVEFNSKHWFWAQQTPPTSVWLWDNFTKELRKVA